ncbi:hypothetical protein F5Y05DRAFT_55317 [Hypoxylon sp. FL0543]|nr:hypothetical protein F5Y05DRAFT_55317 [Hypoxylon sp. FL0543]
MAGFPTAPPSLSNGDPAPFWGALENNIIAGLEESIASLYFRCYGWDDNAISSEIWRDVEWTIGDFAIFYDCPEAEAAWETFVKDYLSQNPIERSPEWREITIELQRVLGDVDRLQDYTNMHPADQVEKGFWTREDHWIAYILRMINYRSIIYHAGPEDLGDFEHRVWAYAFSFGADNPFYRQWDASDKWCAMYLLYAKLSFLRDSYTVKYLLDNPHIPVPEGGIHPVVTDEVRRREVEEAEQRMQDWINFRNNLTGENYLRRPPPWYRRLWYRPMWFPPQDGQQNNQ